MHHELEHFVKLANWGAHAGASGGERRAANIALTVVGNVPGLDSDAIEGLKQLIDLAAADYKQAASRRLAKSESALTGRETLR